jgi:hypothetical protein
MKTVLPDIFQYIDFRKYLADYYVARKAVEPGFSHACICRRLGQEKSKAHSHSGDGGKLSIYPLPHKIRLIANRRVACIQHQLACSPLPLARLP